MRESFIVTEQAAAGEIITPILELHDYWAPFPFASKCQMNTQTLGMAIAPPSHREVLM
jgi:hypothetical protein